MNTANIFAEELKRINEIEGATYVLSKDGQSAVINGTLVLQYHCDSWTVDGETYEIPGFYPVINGKSESVKPVKLELLYSHVATWLGEQVFSPRELVARRSALGLSQTELADILGVSQAALALWENGKRRPAHAASVLDELQRLEDRADLYVSKTVVDALETGGGLLVIPREVEASYSVGFCNIILARAARELRQRGHNASIF